MDDSALRTSKSSRYRRDADTYLRAWALRPSLLLMAPRVLEYFMPI